MRANTPDERATSDRLSKRFWECALQCKELSAIDPTESPLAWETLELSELCGTLQRAVDAGRMRFSTCLTMMEALLNCQEDAIRERKHQLKRHNLQ